MRQSSRSPIMGSWATCSRWFRRWWKKSRRSNSNMSADEKVVPAAIYENYREYLPPEWVRPAVEEFLHTIPERFRGRIPLVVLTEAALIGKGKTRRVDGKRHPRNEWLGFYRRAWRGQPPWVQIIVDNLIHSVPVRETDSEKQVVLKRSLLLGTV